MTGRTPKRRVLELAGIEHQAPIPQADGDDAYRGDVNREWLSMFPDEDDRPARHIVRTDLRRGMLVQCEFVAVLGDCTDGTD